MDFIQNFPFFSILLSLGSGVLTSIIDARQHQSARHRIDVRLDTRDIVHHDRCHPPRDKSLLCQKEICRCIHNIQTDDLFDQVVVITVLSAVLFVYMLGVGKPYTFMMGHFPAPWGNEADVL